MQSELTIALAGNPNSGKTTAFNSLTGSHQHVGNYPGITVEKKEGYIRLLSGESVRVIDLPGTYSLTAYTQEETVARHVLARERPDVVIDVLNAGALERNLYLTIQLLELGVPVVLALNMMDEAARQGMSIDLDRLAERLGLPVLATVARTGEGLPELLAATEAYIATRRGAPWKPLHISYGPDLDPVLKDMEGLIMEAGLLAEEYPARWVALKLLEADEEIVTRSRAAAPELAADLEGRVDEVTRLMRDTLNTWPEAVIADYRYGFISSLLRDGVLVRRQDMHARIHLSDHMDKVLTHPFMGPVIMFGVLYLLYTITFKLGQIPMDWVTQGFALLREGADAVLPEGQIKSLVLSGIIDGVGGVMSFVPLIMLIFLQISFLEDTGYMARMAYMLDRIFRIFGLHGCSVMPFIVGGGIANTFLKAAGYEVGKSLYEPDLVDSAAKIMEEAKERGSAIPLPVDVVVGPSLDAHAPATVLKADEVRPDDMILDIGPDTAELYAGLIAEAGTVVWNGPVGAFEIDQFGKGTEAVAKAVAETSAYTVTGGGDSIAALEKYGYTSQVDYISTAGGAFLEMLEGKALPAVVALEARAAS